MAAARLSLSGKRSEMVRMGLWMALMAASVEGEQEARLVAEKLSGWCV